MKEINKIENTLSELDRRSGSKQDVVVPASQLTMRPSETGVMLSMGGEGAGVLDRAHNQMASITKIPANYYGRLRASDPFMLAGNVNHWLHQSDKSHMVRLLDGNARAVMSDMYLRIDNEVIARHALPEVLKRSESVYPLQSMITDDRISMKFLHQDLSANIDGNGVIRPAIIITNSETGQGRFNVQSFFYRDFCKNGCIFGTTELDVGIKQVHRGARLPAGMLSQETLGYMSQTIAAQTKDIINYVFSEAGFSHMVDKLKATTDSERVAPAHAGDLIKVLGQDFQLSHTEREGALTDLLNDGDFSQWGVLNSITKQANVSENNDRIHTLESTGAKIIDIDRANWTRLVNRVNAMPVRVAT